MAGTGTLHATIIYIYNYIYVTIHGKRGFGSILANMRL